MQLKYYFMTITGLLLVVNACKKPYEEKAIGDPIYSSANVKSALAGKWVLSMATQTDEKSLTKESIDILDFFTLESGSQLPNITFVVAGQTYTSDTTGVAVAYFGTAGTWSLDDEAYPTKVILNGDAGIIEVPIGTNIQISGGSLMYQETGKCSTDGVMTTKLILKKS